ncbi:hexose kinase [Actinoplanes sp. NPDC026670]|uniref:1-phosphofructokinase family hexose kinase n=1 Tax=Actinoplanes sp. NPDC026670 TaxID=3154700 RepID=UPI0033DC0236
MIVTVTLNPALDLTYTVDALVPHGTHRVTTVAERPGGKGLNVARVLHTLGEPVLATGLLGGPTGRRVSALLAADGVPASFVEIGGETRRTVAVVDGSAATGFWEPGPAVTEAEWSRFTDHFRQLLPGATVVVLSGSPPAGPPPSVYAALIVHAREAGVPALLDTSGPALHEGLRAGPALAKPNDAELAALRPGSPPPAGHAEIVEAVRAVADGAVVVSRGAAGLIAVVGDEVWECVPPVALGGNPTGAGDACAAALARGLRDRTPWPDLLADAVALSAAAVANPVAGAFDADVYRRTRAAAKPVGVSGGSRARLHR